MKALYAIALLAACLCVPALSGQNTTIKKPRGTNYVPVQTTNDIPVDTIYNVTDSVIASGFDKPLRATQETLFIINRSSRHITSISFDIEYRDMRDRMLHRTTHTLNVDIPANETRYIKFPTFDKNSQFYYHLSKKPSRTTQATPFKVALNILFITAIPLSPQ